MFYRNILLIDDDQDDQEIFLAALRSLSDSVLCSVSDKANDALSKLSTKNLTADLIFLDLNMPLMSGQEFLKEIKQDDGLKHIPIVIFSTTSNNRTVQETKNLGAHDFITKPDNFDELRTIIKNYIGI